MKGLGTIVNFLAVILGSGLGLIIKNGLKQRFHDILIQACGLATLFIGLSGAMAGLMKLSDKGAFETSNTMLLVFSLVIGGLIGEALNLEIRMENLGDKLKRLLKDNNDTQFVEGFVTATLVICVGAMAIVGSIEDGLTGDATMLFAKSMLDFIIVMVFASSLGIGVMFSSIPLLVYQGAITLSAALISHYMDDRLISYLSCIGSVLIFGVGINLIFGKKLKVGNLLPAIIIPVVYSIFF
ncbi:DUF554 domain-containing protein [Anaerocolumna xylanovorans]|uniref:DUF554 domain-containing protein n=1 Tax=Anaerocolumna xylanovorans DSM 12503 TaxID=1121345 RepID=A0A1M7XX65_9FIRM|nr:DUF554 domain-containing protein [Anaerocolumna xylanovorans]SHO43289.1 hypothetical protein SAMN02745217_00160 [Anaerocolumna xylanovorans DSM 12503]